jgi:hypothetical protein
MSSTSGEEAEEEEEEEEMEEDEEVVVVDVNGIPSVDRALLLEVLDEPLDSSWRSVCFIE